MSPITGQEIGILEMRVAKNRESIRGMKVRILSGLRLEVQADPADQGRYTLQTAYSQLLRSKYQVLTVNQNYMCQKYSYNSYFEIVELRKPFFCASCTN